jgi:hypothetical protein
VTAAPEPPDRESGGLVAAIVLHYGYEPARQPGESADDGPVTPELALVHPDLARSARAQLPDRPWERPGDR